MQEIKCPRCGEVFQVDEAGYAEIARQVRDKEYRRELSETVDRELALARSEQEAKHREELSGRDLRIAQLTGLLDKAGSDRELAVSETARKKDMELRAKEEEIERLREQNRNELALRDAEIERLKSFKAQLSTKMVGESLEEHCLTQFNGIRTTAFPNAYFEKDNDARSGSKGDFIFRDYADGTEFISIMFEMKNEVETTASKHRNEDLFRELDRDRREKKCEYAVLVSMLESESDLYNGGIVDVSYRYPKMFVVRPQFFLPIISLLRNAALNSAGYRKQLEEARDRQLDLRQFEENLSAFKEGFARSFGQARDRYRDAIDGIDKTIATLTKIRENLVRSEKHLVAANNKAEEVTIRRLTKGAPFVQAMLDGIGAGKAAQD